MTLDPRTPVIIGAAQVSRPLSGSDDLQSRADPIALMAEAVDQAATDCGARSVLGAIQTIAVVGGLWRYRDPASLVAAELGLTDVSTVLTGFGGNIPVHLTAEFATRIASGDLDVAIIVGGECNATRRALSKLDERPPQRDEAEDPAVEQWGPALDMGDSVAIERGGEIPRNTYAVLDSAIRAHRGETLDEARTRAARMWEDYASVAAGNPHAADSSGPTAQEIRTPTPANRMVSWPYTKAMCANNAVDQAGALIICSTEAADRMGVPNDRRVHPHSCVTAADTSSLLAREHLPTAPGLEAACAHLVDSVGSVDAIDHFDLYACFPSIVALTTEALGIGDSRSLTVTGGLAFAGAPLNFAAGQSLIAMIQQLRDDAGSMGLVQGNGGHAAKHALGLYSTQPPTDPHRIVDLRTDVAPLAAATPDVTASATLTGVTVEYDHDGPARAVALVTLADGSRTWVNSDDDQVMKTVMHTECVGSEVGIDAGLLTL